MLAALELAGADVPLTTIDEGLRAEDVVYRQVQLQGHYDYERQFLLDNRIHQEFFEIGLLKVDKCRISVTALG